MRNQLKQLQEQRMKFIGIFKRYGSKSNWHGFPETTLILVDIKDNNGKIVTDHIWFKQIKGFVKINPLIEGDIIEFEARVKDYVKGYCGRKAEEYGEAYQELDYKLNFPTKIRKLQNDNNKK